MEEENMKFLAKSVRTGMIATSLLLGCFWQVRAQTAGQSFSVKNIIGSPASVANRDAFDRGLNENAMHFAKARGISYQTAVTHLKIDDALAMPIAQLRMQ